MEENKKDKKNIHSENDNKTGKRMEDKKNKKVKKHKGLKRVIIVMLILLIIVPLAVIGAGYWYLQDKASKVSIIEIDESKLGISESVKQNLDTYRNIVIYGIDENSTSYEDGYSDSIIIASLNEDTSEVSLTSIYRDTYMEIEGHGLDKVTQAYEFGGPQLSMNTLNTNMDLNIEEFVTVNFDAVEDIVDYVGGITVNITYEEIGKISYISRAGTYTLNGTQALQYARIRNATGGDFGRTERLRTVLEAVANKVSTYNVLELNEFADFCLERVYTNIKVEDILGMIPSVPYLTITESQGWPYEVESMTIDSWWYSVPVNLEKNVTDLHQNLFNNSYYEPTETVKNISEEIKEKSGLE